MSAPDLFLLFRRMLLIFCTVYAVIKTSQTVWRYIAFLSRPEKSRAVLRHYLLLHIMRVRWKRFAMHYLHIGVLLTVLALIIYAHRYVG